MKKVFRRRGGKSKGTKDKYWFTPKMKFRLRSMPEVRRFLDELAHTDGDESLAMRRMVGSKSVENVVLPDIIDLTSVSTESLTDMSDPVVEPLTLPFNDDLADVLPLGSDGAFASPFYDDHSCLLPVVPHDQLLWPDEIMFPMISSYTSSGPVTACYPYIEGYALQLYQCTTDLVFNMANSIAKAYPDWGDLQSSLSSSFRQTSQLCVQEFVDYAIRDVIRVFRNDTVLSSPAKIQEQTDDIMKHLKWESIFDGSVEPYEDDDAEYVDRVSISMSILRNTVPDLVFEILRAIAPQNHLGASWDSSPSSIRWSVREICNMHVPTLVQKAVHDLVYNMCPDDKIPFMEDSAQAAEVTRKLGWCDYVREHD